MIETPVVMSWSGGKDCCLALHELQRSPGHRVTSLLTTITGDPDRISMHGVRIELLDRQASALGLAVDPVLIPANASNEAYEAAMAAALRRHAAEGARTIAFGDLFLPDVRAYRERMLEPLQVTPIFPVWGRDTHTFVERFIAQGFRAVLVCVDLSRLDASFAGRMIDADLLADLPRDVDPCGENGEFHTFVFDGPNFAAPVPFALGDSTIRNGFCFRDLIPAAAMATHGVAEARPGQ